MMLGLVCDTCDAFCPIDAQNCLMCSTPLAGRSTAAPAASLSTVKSAENRCAKCGAVWEADFRFCGQCGATLGAEAAKSAPAPVPEPVSTRGVSAKTMFFGTMQAPGKAKLILIKGDGMDGVSYVLSATEHEIGRTDGAIVFPEDPLLSPRHANFYYDQGKLYIRDEQSKNGVFLRIHKPATLGKSRNFLIGEQLLEVIASQNSTEPEIEPDGTYFYGSPRKPGQFSITQKLVGGSKGLTMIAPKSAFTLGRQGNDMNFPDDPFISGHHARVDLMKSATGGNDFVLTDLGSKNGTFIRIENATLLQHGDYVFLGQQLLRVEIT